MTELKKHPASFRDPSGFVYHNEGTLYRFVSRSIEQEWKQFLSSGLYEKLVAKKLLLPFREINENHWNEPGWLITLEPQQISILNYPWEWSFSQLKDAALTTLEICQTALQHQMILKDATHLNIQFVDGKPQWIDSLSFELYKEGEPWIAYQQFCECFLNPLLIAAYKPMEVHRLLLSYPSGIPAYVTTALLPWTTKLHTGILLHVHLQSKISKQKKQASAAKNHSLSQKGLQHILQSLEEIIKKLSPRKTSTSNWNNYYEEGILSDEYLTTKKQLVTKWLNELNYSNIIDFGTNNGEFALACNQTVKVVALDMDSACIDQLYQTVKSQGRTNILPLVIDLSTPSPATGWFNKEQPSFLNRTSFDAGMALALIHHLAIGKNIPLEQTAALFAGQCHQLLIEWVPKEDPKVKDMLQNRKDIFENYRMNSFEDSYGSFFRITKKEKIGTTQRTLYLMERK